MCVLWSPGRDSGWPAALPCRSLRRPGTGSGAQGHPPVLGAPQAWRVLLPQGPGWHMPASPRGQFPPTATSLLLKAVPAPCPAVQPQTHSTGSLSLHAASAPCRRACRPPSPGTRGSPVCWPEGPVWSGMLRGLQTSDSGSQGSAVLVSALGCGHGRSRPAPLPLKGK